MRTTHQQGMRVFGSFDLVGSTELKLRLARDARKDASKQGDRPDWIRPLVEFFREVPDMLGDKLTELFVNVDLPRTTLEIWRVAGDEILFVSGRLETSAQIMVIAHAFNSVLHKTDLKFLRQYKLGVKAVIWAAGFPIRNVEMYINPRGKPHVYISTLNFENPEPLPHVDGSRLRPEFQGPEIDLGFRLAALAQPRRLAASLEVAYYLAKNSMEFQNIKPSFYHVGWSKLKGVYGETPYPIIWLDYNERPESRSSYEEVTSPFCREFLSGAAKRDAQAIVQLEADYLEDTKDFRIKPYISTDARFEESHTDIYERLAKGKL